MNIEEAKKPLLDLMTKRVEIRKVVLQFTLWFLVLCEFGFLSSICLATLGFGLGGILLGIEASISSNAFLCRRTFFCEKSRGKYGSGKKIGEDQARNNRVA